MICSMDEAQSASGETRPADPDLHWTGWALDTLRELGGVLVAGHDPLVTERFPSDDGVIHRIQGTT